MAEREHRWIESFELCHKALALSPQDPDALNLLGRLCAVAADLPRAIGLQRFVLKLAPSHAKAPHDLADALAAVRSADDARNAYDAAIAIEPDIACHHRLPGALNAFVGIDRAEELLRRCVELDASFAPAQAALGNVLMRRRLIASAIEAYSIAVLLDWDCAEAHLGLAGLLELAHDDSAALRHYGEAFARKQVYVAPDRGAVRRVLVLKAPGKALYNTALDFLINHARTALHALYVAQDEERLQALPPYDVLFCGLDESESSDPCAQRCLRLIASDPTPVINHPRHLQKLRRSQLRATLANVADCAVPFTIRTDRDGVGHLLASPDAAGLEYPLLIRPVDTHRGDGLELLSSAADAASYLTRFADAHFNVSAFVDYGSADGFYRKYRVVVVDGKPFAYHLGISEHWMIHYVTSPMAEHAWMRAEEERFLRDPESVFPAWNATFGVIADAVGLDYFGVDCTRTFDDGILVFEAGPAMLVHCVDSAETFPYKYRYVPRIFDAVERLFDRAISQQRRFARS